MLIRDHCFDFVTSAVLPGSEEIVELEKVRWGRGGSRVGGEEGLVATTY